MGARARNPNMPVVLRIAEASFAASIARHFDFRTTYSAAALAAPAFAGLARMPRARGRITFGGQEFAIAEYRLRDEGSAHPPSGAIPIAVARDNRLALVHELAELQLDNRVLVLVPLVQFESDAVPAETQAEAVIRAIP